MAERTKKRNGGSRRRRLRVLPGGAGNPSLPALFLGSVLFPTDREYEPPGVVDECLALRDWAENGLGGLHEALTDTKDAPDSQSRVTRKRSYEDKRLDALALWLVAYEGEDPSMPLAGLVQLRVQFCLAFTVVNAWAAQLCFESGETEDGARLLSAAWKWRVRALEEHGRPSPLLSAERTEAARDARVRVAAIKREAWRNHAAQVRKRRNSKLSASAIARLVARALQDTKFRGSWHSIRKEITKRSEPQET